MVIGSNIDLRTQAMYAAEAGLDRARAILNASPQPNIDALLRGTNPTLDNVPTAMDPQTGEPNGAGALLVDIDGTVLRSIPYPPPEFGRSGASEALLQGRYTVYVRNDTAECRMNSGMANFTKDANTAVVLRVVGVALDGKTTAVLETTVARASVPSPSGGAPADDTSCVSGKNASDDNASNVRGFTAQ